MKGTIMRRKLFTVLSTWVVIAALTAVAAAPALADQPVSFEVSFAYEDVNPCTGELVTYNETLTVTEHQDHPSNFVGMTSGTGFSSDGYILQSRVDHFQVNKNNLTLNLTEIWRHPDGSALSFHLNLKVDVPTDELRFEKVRLECLGA